MRGETGERPMIDLGFGTSVLVVDDTPSVLMMITDLLQSRNLLVTTAESPLEGAKLIGDTNKHFDLVILDVVMSPFTGPQLAQAAREARPGVGILFISGHKHDDLVEQGHLSATDLFQEKPFRFDDLIASCKKALDSRQANA